MAQTSQGDKLKNEVFGSFPKFYTFERHGFHVRSCLGPFLEKVTIVDLGRQERYGHWATGMTRRVLPFDWRAVCRERVAAVRDGARR